MEAGMKGFRILNCAPSPAMAGAAAFLALAPATAMPQSILVV